MCRNTIHGTQMGITFKAKVTLNDVAVELEGSMAEVIAGVKELTAMVPPAPGALSPDAEAVAAVVRARAEGGRNPRGHNKEMVYTTLRDHMAGAGRMAHIQKKMSEVHHFDMPTSSLKHSLTQLEEAGRVGRQGDVWAVVAGAH